MGSHQIKAGFIHRKEDEGKLETKKIAAWELTV
jgi:hypothetical protein